jgi:exodeoxyribonuclease VII small subunit
MKEIKFEEALKKLEEIVDKLETGDVSLDDSLKVFEEGNDLVKMCLKKLNEAEQKIKSISDDLDIEDLNDGQEE